MHARFCFLPHRDRIPANSRVHPSFHCLLCLAIMHPAFSIRCAQGAKSPIKAHADGGSTHTRRRWKLPHVHLRHSCLLPKSYEMHLLPPPLALACKTIQLSPSPCRVILAKSVLDARPETTPSGASGPIVPIGPAIEIFNSPRLARL